MSSIRCAGAQGSTEDFNGSWGLTGVTNMHLGGTRGSRAMCTMYCIRVCNYIQVCASCSEQKSIAMV